MAKKEEKAAPVAPPPMVEPVKRNFLWLWIVLAGLSFLFFLVALHLVGVLGKPEEALYASTKNVPVINIFTKPLHKEIADEKLSPEKIVDIKDLQNKLVRSEGEIETLKKTIAEMSAVTSDIDKNSQDIKKMKKNITALTTGDVGAPAASTSSPNASSAAAGSLPPAIAQPTTTANISPITGTGENYRLIAKIFEKLPSDTAVDILNNLSDQEKVKILSNMKDKNIADILAAFDPIKSAELTRMMSRPGGNI